VPRALGYGLLALLLGGVTMLVSLRSLDWSITALARVDSKTAMGSAAHTIDPRFHTVHPGAYDGQFYWGVAVDPIGTGSVHDSFDNASYRYGHPLFGWLGWLVSAGQGGAAAAALAALALAALVAAAVLAGGFGGRAGLFTALNPGLLFAVVNDLAEPLAAALVLGALTAYLRGRRVATVVCLVLLPLAKEPLVLVAAALVLWELLHRRIRDAALLAATVLPAAAWWLYARIHFGAWFTSGDSALAAPFAGWRRAILDAGVFGANSGQGGGGVMTLPILLALLALLALAAFAAARVRGPVQLVYLALAAVAACLATNATETLSDALRNTAVLLVLVPLVTTRGSARASGSP